MLQGINPRPWICSKCIRQVTSTQRRLATAAPQHVFHKFLAVDKTSSNSRVDDKVLRQIFDSHQFWKDFSQPSRDGYHGRNTGLFQNRFLTGPAGFEKFASISLNKAKRIVDKVLAASSPEEYRATVRDMDRLSDLLCRVIDLSDFVRATHPDIRIQKAATKAYMMMYEYMNILNTTTGLNKQLMKARTLQETTREWTTEEFVVADTLIKDFAKSAIELPDTERQRFVTISQDISEVGSEFVDYMAPKQELLVFPSSKLKGIDPLVAKWHTKSRGRTEFPTMGPAAAAALRTVQDAEIRKEILIARQTPSNSTLVALRKLLVKRAELAKLSKYDSYGHMALEDKMANTPESVSKFLRALSVENTQISSLEMDELLKAKGATLTLSNPSLEAWDVEYYMNRILSSVPSRTRNSDFISAYFSLGTVMQGLSRLFTHLYGIRFAPHETLPGETWNSDVRRIDVISEEDGHVAVLYCDLFSRPGKSRNPAHFTLRCSREILQEELEEDAAALNPLFASPDESVNDGMATSRSSGVLKQLPTIALICDFTTEPDSTKPALLTFNEVRTLFHEMGHAIHSILGRTSLQNVSGTRCATDFVELPSVLMESFAADPTVLGLFARHYSTDEPLPYEMVADSLALEKRFEGSDTEHQIIQAMVDQLYHSSLPLEVSFDTTESYRGLQQAYGVGPVNPKGTSWEGFFGHLFGYGSTYYSYLFDRVLARRVWGEVFDSGMNGNAIKRENGERMKQEVLQWGGSRDPWSCLSGVLRDDRVKDGGEEAMKVVGSWGLKK